MGRSQEESSNLCCQGSDRRGQQKIGAFFGAKGSALKEIVRKMEKRLDNDRYFSQEIVTMKDSLVK